MKDMTPAMQPTTKTARVLTLDDGCPELPLVVGKGRAVALIWPGSGATSRTMHHVTLEDGGATILQRHDGEAVYYVKSGTGVVIDPDAASRDPLVEGNMVFIEAGTAYRFEADTSGMVLLGGPCPADLALYSHL